MADGDAHAAAGFVRRFQNRVYGLALSIVGRPAAAEDVAQEAFTRAWRFAGGFDARRGNVVSWLLTITRNAAIDAIRLQRDQTFEPEVLLAMLTRRDTGGIAPAELVDEADRIRHALRSLPREQAVAVVLAIFYGMTAREIAEREAVPLGTIKTRIRLGMSHLRDHYRDNSEVSDG